MNPQKAQEIIKKTRKDYNVIAIHFAETRGKVWVDFSDKFSKYFRDRQKVLDLGCGNGRFSLVSREYKNTQYVGVDFSEKLIAIAKEQHDDERAEFLVGDILDLSFLKEKFDVILCIATLPHIPSNELRLKFLEQVKSLLSDNGVLIMTAWDLWNEKGGRKKMLQQGLLKMLGKNKMDFGDVLIPWKNQQGEVLAQRYYHAFTKKSFVNLVKKSGFKIVESGVLRGHNPRHVNFYIVAGRGQ